MDDFFAVAWKDGSVVLLDQLKLPDRVVYRRFRTAESVALAIKKMVVRGAPAIGVAAGFGMCLEANRIRTDNPEIFIAGIKEAGAMLVSTRPTAVNLRWAVNRIIRVVEAAIPGGMEDARRAALDEARLILAEDSAANRRIGEFGAGLVPDGARILTHCNAGALAVGGYGTAIGVIRAAHEAGKRIHVFVDETRPYLQGARLTAWELCRYGIAHSLITDGMAGHFMSRGEIDLVVTGADRIAANGDTANKIGTYTLAVLARENKKPFYIAAPVSTLDPSIRTGREIPIEERSPDEVTKIMGRRICPAGTKARHPAFDVTPARYITAIITEKGVLRPPFHLKEVFLKPCVTGCRY